MFDLIKSFDDLKEFLANSRWQTFEEFVGYIFEENDYDVKVNYVKMLYGRVRRQYDVIAENFNYLFVVDCKFWSKNRYKSSALKNAAETHIERCKHLETDKKIIPLIVTSNNEDIFYHEDVFIVPVDKLNLFLRDY